jgi:hypothetical protein
MMGASLSFKKGAGGHLVPLYVYVDDKRTVSNDKEA